jgi:hypothetical protein
MSLCYQKINLTSLWQKTSIQNDLTQFYTENVFLCVYIYILYVCLYADITEYMFFRWIIQFINFSHLRVSEF